MKRAAINPYLGLSLGVIALSFGAILVRYAQAPGQVPALAIAAYRLTFSALVLLPLVGWRARGQVRALGRRDLLLGVLSGFFLACHFATWIASLEYTTVASSVVLVDTSPLWVGLVSPLLGDRVGRWMALGIGVSVVGGILIGAGDFSVGGTALWGDALALCGALMVSAYILLGRHLRQRLTLLTYVSLVYTAAAAFLVLFALVARVPLVGYSVQTVVACLLLALGPQLLGHSSINWALGYLSPAFVTVTVLGEPVGATILAFFLLQEVPPPATLVGGTLILAGIYLASREERARARAVSD